MISLALRTTGQSSIITTNRVNKVIAGVKAAKTIAKQKGIETQPRLRKRPTNRTRVNYGAARRGCIEAEVFIPLPVGMS